MKNPTKKKTIPLLKKGQSSSFTNNYNDHVRNGREAIAEDNNTIDQNVDQDKGFLSEDTDANSRLTAFTNKPSLNRHDQKHEERRSLSPKVEGKKKIVVKLSSNNLNKK